MDSLHAGAKQGAVHWPIRQPIGDEFAYWDHRRKKKTLDGLEGKWALVIDRALRGTYDTEKDAWQAMADAQKTGYVVQVGHEEAEVEERILRGCNKD